MKRLISILTIAFVLFFVVGCSSTDTSTDTSDDTMMDNDQEITEELIGTWLAKGDNDDSETVYEFDEDGSYTESITTNDSTDVIKGTYTEYDGDLTLMPETYNGQMETDYVSENNITEDMMEADDYVFKNIEATIKIDGDTMELKVGDKTTELTKEG